MKGRLVPAAAAAVALALLAIVGAQTVLAHSRPIRFDPAPGAVLSTAPERVNGWFTADLRRDPNWTFLRVTDASGNRVDAGETVLGADRRQLTVPLRGGLGLGRYLVNWRTFDEADGAIFGDCYTFFIGQAAADQAVTDKTRLDGGSSCQRIEVEAKNGTPVPNFTPEAAGGHDEAEASDSADSDGGDVPVWALVIGVAGGVALGLVGGRLISGRS